MNVILHCSVWCLREIGKMSTWLPGKIFANAHAPTSCQKNFYWASRFQLQVLLNDASVGPQRCMLLAIAYWYADYREMRKRVPTQQAYQRWPEPNIALYLSKSIIAEDEDCNNIYQFKYVLSTMGVSMESISKFLIGNRFHVKLRILSPYSNRIHQTFINVFTSSMFYY